MSSKVTLKVTLGQHGQATIRASGNWRDVIMSLHGAAEELLHKAKRAGLTDKPARRVRLNFSEDPHAFHLKPT